MTEEKSFFSFKFEEPVSQKQRRPKRLRALRRAALTIAEILKWADAHFRRVGSWPVVVSGPIDDADGDSWCAIDNALRFGKRGLPGGTSLARLLEEHRGKPIHLNRPSLTVKRVLAWADAHYRRTGRWPSAGSGPIEDADGENWSAVHSALYVGFRGLPGGTTLARLLEEHRGRPTKFNRPSLTPKQILAWADAHLQRTGRWPTAGSGPVDEAPGETWCGIRNELRRGGRGLPGGSSLARLLEEHRDRRNHKNSPALTVEQILGWADAHFRRTGRWPIARSGSIGDAPDETWAAINHALIVGLRGLPGGTTLPRLLQEHRGWRNRKNPPSLTVSQILDWADAHFRRTKRWPTALSGPIKDAGGETWGAVHTALIKGIRGLPGRSSLARLLDKHRRKSRRSGTSR
jgi:hypothetical protein